MPVVPALRGRGKQILGPDQPAHLPSPKEKLQNQQESLSQKQQRAKPYRITNITLLGKKKKQSKTNNKTEQGEQMTDCQLTCYLKR